MKREITACDICGAPYDPAKEAEEPMHRIGFVDPPAMAPHEEARLDAELKAIAREAANPQTTTEAKAYYMARADAMTNEAKKRRAISPDDRVDVDLLCHGCFVKVRAAIKRMRDSKA